MSLRPIGTVFSIVAPASYTSSNPHPHRITYRITGHAVDHEGKELESVECIAYEELPAPTFIPFTAMVSAQAYVAWQKEYAKQFETTGDTNDRS